MNRSTNTRRDAAGRMPSLNVSERRLHYEERGAGPLAIFLHGFPLDASTWRETVPLLSGHRRCVALDLPGFGRSDAISAPVLTMDLMADQVAAAMTHLGERRADFVGFSMGGYVLLALLERAPEAVRSCVFVDSRADADSAEMTESRRDLEELVVRQGRGALYERMITGLVAESTGNFERAWIRTMIESLRCDTIVAALRGMSGRPDRRGVLPTISVPALVIRGERDQLIPLATALAMAQSIPNGRLAEIPQAGHSPPIEAPKQLSEMLISFWGEHLHA